MKTRRSNTSGRGPAGTAVGSRWRAKASLAWWPGPEELRAYPEGHLVAPLGVGGGR